MAAENNHHHGENECGCAVMDFCMLPEGCIANTLSMTSPRDACRLALVSYSFCSAAESDAVWERFLPSDYPDIIARSVLGPSTQQLDFASKKELYLHLCDHPLIIDGGTKSFSLEKWSGKKCYMLAATDLSIVWGNTPAYWRWTSLPEARFSEVAELIGVTWLEIHGKISTGMLSPDTTYAAYLVFKLAAGACGFDRRPAEVSVGIIGCETETRTVYLEPEGAQRHRYLIIPRPIGIFNRPRKSNSPYPKQRADGWMEIELGEHVNKGEQDGELDTSVMEVSIDNGKRGLIVQGIEIRPKEGK